MHGRIIQLSSKRIAKGCYACPDDFYENSGDFADYVGDELKGDERKDEIQALAETLEDLFNLDKNSDALVYKGDAAMAEFKKAWVEAIRKAASEVTVDNVLQSPRYRGEKLCRGTHRCSDYRIYIDGYNGYAGPMEDLITWMAFLKLKEGQKVYVGAVIDYHG